MHRPLYGKNNMKGKRWGNTKKSNMLVMLFCFFVLRINLSYVSHTGFFL